MSFYLSKSLEHHNFSFLLPAHVNIDGKKIKKQLWVPDAYWTYQGYHFRDCVDAWPLRYTPKAEVE